MSRARFLPFFANHPASTVLLEACGSAHHWGRALEQLGHTVRLLPPHETRRYVRRTKTDRTDARAWLEAARNEEIHAVPIKSETQQAVASPHRIRTTWLRTRTARFNTLRGLLREFGITITVGPRHLVPRVMALIADAESPVPMSLRTPLAELCDEVTVLTCRLKDLERHLAGVAEQLPQVALLRTIPGIGLLNATALVACVGDVRRFPTGRHFASYLGLTPREHSSGGRRRLGAITSKGISISVPYSSMPGAAPSRTASHPREPRRSRCGLAPWPSAAGPISRRSRLPTGWRAWRGACGGMTARLSSRGPWPRRPSVPGSFFPRRTAASTDGTPVRPARGHAAKCVAIRAERTIGIPARDFHPGLEHQAFH